MQNFNFNKTCKEIEINGKVYVMTIDMKTITYFKKHYKTSFLQALQSIGELDEVKTLELLGSMIRENEEGEPVGKEFFNNSNPISVVISLTPLVIELMGDNLPEAENESEKK